MVREFARDSVLPTAAERDLTGEFPAENLKKMGELGLLGMNAPVEYNGAGVDTVSYCLALQEIAYACASTAVIMSVHNSVACGPINLFGSDSLKDKYLRKAGHRGNAGLICPDGTGRRFRSRKPENQGGPGRRQLYHQRQQDVHYHGQKFPCDRGHGLYGSRTKKHRGISAFVVEKGYAGVFRGQGREKDGASRFRYGGADF